MKVILDVVEGPQHGRALAFEAGQIALIGRSHKCGVYSLDSDPEIARTHILLQVALPVCRIRDLGSARPTSLNGRVITSGEMADGDILKIGQTTLRMRFDETLDPETIEEPDRFSPETCA